MLFHPVDGAGFSFIFGCVFRRNFLAFLFAGFLPSEQQYMEVLAELLFGNNQGLPCSVIDVAALIANFLPALNYPQMPSTRFIKGKPAYELT